MTPLTKCGGLLEGKGLGLSLFPFKFRWLVSVRCSPDLMAFAAAEKLVQRLNVIP